MNEQEFISNLLLLNIENAKEKIEKLNIYSDLLVEWNEKFNLTSIKDKESIFLKHFYDSLCLVKTNLLKNNLSLCDFGTGAGFPGLVIAIYFPNISVTLIESNGKKCEFLNYVKTKLNLENVIVINSRMEDYSKNNREKFDLITCRAVSHLRILSEICVASLKKNGYFIPLKSKVDDEIKDSTRTLKVLNLNLQEIIEYKLPIENSDRSILIIKKMEQTETKYPRLYKQIINKTL